MAVNSIRALFQSLFEEESDASPASPTSAAAPRMRASPPRRRMGSNAIQPSQVWSARMRARRESASAQSADRSSESSEPGATAAYTPRAADGEYTVRFQDRPLGMGLVPSTQLYGSWEVSSVNTTISRERDNDHVQYDERNHKHRVARGDVVIAINGSCATAHLRRDELGQYLQTCSLPIAVTLRKPELYAALDSRSVATAMYPLSSDYESAQALSEPKRFTARASSAQWQRTLQHELSRNASRAKSREAKRLALALSGGRSRAPSSETRSERSPSAASSSSVTPSPTEKSRMAQQQQRQATSMSATLAEQQRPATTAATGAAAAKTRAAAAPESVALSPMGEFIFTFTEHPLRLVLAPSTRHYGSVEIYDAKVHAPQLHVGDVVMAVNNDASVSRWSTDDVIDYIADLQPPVAITFRRPAAYRQYLESFFKTASRAPVSSHSVANAMFPLSAEYKKSPPKAARKRLDSTSPVAPPLPPPLSVSMRELVPSKRAGAAASPPVHRRHGSELLPEPDADTTLSPEMQTQRKISEMRAFSSQIDATEQFKHWSGSAGTAAQTSSILTEKHVRFLWRSLPEFLRYNRLELAYSTRFHGWNTLSFYAKLANRGPTLLVIHDTRDNIFGAFCSMSWTNSSSVYGNGRSFVFTLRPQLKVYPWSGLESSFMYSRRDAVFVGGGAKGIALCLQLDDMRGFSHACETFDSPPLTDRGEFECEVCEVWSFGGLRI